MQADTPSPQPSPIKGEGALQGCRDPHDPHESRMSLIQMVSVAMPIISCSICAYLRLSAFLCVQLLFWQIRLLENEGRYELRGSRQHFLLDAAPFFGKCDLEIVACLKVHPELRRRAEVA